MPPPPPQPPPGERLAHLAPYSIRRDNDVRGCLLDLNESTLPHCASLAAALRGDGEEDVRRYPVDGALHAALLEDLAAYLNAPDLTATTADHHPEVTPANLVITAGSEHALQMVCAAYGGDTARELLLPVPDYDRFAGLWDAAGPHGAVHRVALSADASCDAVEATLTRALAALADPAAAVVYLSRPNNPLGHTVAAETVRRWALARPRTLFVVDEAYIEWAAASSTDATQSVSVARAAVAPSSRNLIVVRTFSKVFGLAGLRIGYAVAHADVVRDVLARVADDKAVTVRAMRAARCVLAHAHDHYLPGARSMHAACAALVRRYADDAPEGPVVCTLRDGMYALLRTRDGSDPAPLVRWLADRGFVVRNKHPSVAGGVRATLAPAETFERLLDACRAYVPPTAPVPVPTPAGADGDDEGPSLYDVDGVALPRGWCASPDQVLLLLDVDGTLRPGAQAGSPVHPWTADLLARVRGALPRVRIVTNNTTESPADLSAALDASSVPIHTPWDALALHRAGLPTPFHAYVVGNAAARVALRDRCGGGECVVIGRADLDRGTECHLLCFANTFCMTGPDEWYDVGRILRAAGAASSAAPLLVCFAEWGPEPCVRAAACADLRGGAAPLQAPDVPVPDVMLVWRVLTELHLAGAGAKAPTTVLLGKPDPGMVRGRADACADLEAVRAVVVVGDSAHADLGLAHRLRDGGAAVVVAVLVVPEHRGAPWYDPGRGCYVVSDALQAWEDLLRPWVVVGL